MSELQPQTASSWAVEVIADNSGKFVGNALRLGTQKEAEQYAYDLSMRWYAIREWRVVPSVDPVTYRWDDASRALVSVAA